MEQTTSPLNGGDLAVPRTCQEAWHHISTRARQHALLVPGGPGGIPWAGLARVAENLTGFLTNGDTGVCILAGLAHAGHVRWGLRALLATRQSGAPVWAALEQELDRVPLLADKNALPALLLWSHLQEQAKLHAQALPQVQRLGNGFAIEKSGVLVPIPPEEVREIEQTRKHFLVMREGLITEGMLLIRALTGPPHLRSVPPAAG